jgi:hypothetical protein
MLAERECAVRVGHRPHDNALHAAAIVLFQGDHGVSAHHRGLVAFGIGGSYGRGVMICRSGEHCTGLWGPPCTHSKALTSASEIKNSLASRPPWRGAAQCDNQRVRPEVDQRHEAGSPPRQETSAGPSTSSLKTLK